MENHNLIKLNNCEKTCLRDFRPGPTQIGMTRGVKFRIKVEEGMHYLCSEIKGADQLRGHLEADLRLCFRICKSRFSHDAANFFLSRLVSGYK